MKHLSTRGVMMMRPRAQELMLAEEGMYGCLWLGPKFRKKSKDCKSVMFRVWAAPGARETRQKGGGRSRPPFWRLSKAPGAAQSPKNHRFPAPSTS